MSSYAQLTAAAFGYAKDTVLQVLDTDDVVIQARNAGLLIDAANPGGTVPFLVPGSPIIAAGAAAATAHSNPGADTPTDEHGSLAIVAPAAGMAAGALATVTFLDPLPATPKAILLADHSPVDVGLYVSVRSATGFTISCRTAPAASASITVDYAVLS